MYLADLNIQPHNGVLAVFEKLINCCKFATVVFLALSVSSYIKCVFFYTIRVYNL